MARATVELGVNANPLVSGLASAQQKIRSFGAGISGVFKAGGVGLLAGGIGGLASALSGRAFIGGIGNAIKMGGELRNLGKSTGIAVGELYTLKGVFEENDKGAEEMASSLARMQKAIGSGSEGISDLGLSLEDLLKMRPSQQFQAISKAIIAIPDPANRAAAAMKIFGRSGSSLMSVFEDVARLDLSKLSQAGKIMEKNAEAFDEAGDSITRMKRNINGLFVGAASEMLTALTGVAEKAGESDFVGAGQSIGKKLGKGISNVMSKEWWKNTGSAFIEMLKGNYGKADAMRRGAATSAAPAADPMMGPQEVSSGSGWGRLETFKSFVDPTGFNPHGEATAAKRTKDFYDFFGSGGHGGAAFGSGVGIANMGGGGLPGMSKAYGQTAPKTDDKEKPLNKQDLKEVMQEYWGK